MERKWSAPSHTCSISIFEIHLLSCFRAQFHHPGRLVSAQPAFLHLPPVLPLVREGARGLLKLPYALLEGNARLMVKSSIFYEEAVRTRALKI